MFWLLIKFDCSNIHIENIPKKLKYPGAPKPLAIDLNRSRIKEIQLTTSNGIEKMKISDPKYKQNRTMLKPIVNFL